MRPKWVDRVHQRAKARRREEWENSDMYKLLMGWRQIIPYTYMDGRDMVMGARHISYDGHGKVTSDERHDTCRLVNPDPEPQHWWRFW